MYKKIILLFLTFILTRTLPAQSPPELKAAIQQALAEEGLTGAVWSIVDGEGKIYADAAGISNMQTGELLTPGNKVHIGSVTKTLIATGILRLATQKKLDINDPVKKYLPELGFENPWDKTKPITVRHLMDHTSGLTDIRLWQVFSKKAGPDIPLRYAFIKDTQVLKVYARPGSLFAYSNMGYTLLAMIIESVTKERYEDYLDKNLLQPLGMINSTFRFVAQTGDQADPGLAYGHLDNKTAYPALPMYLRPAGQFTTTAHDMALFAIFMMGNGTIGGTNFIDQSYLSDMGHPEGTVARQHGLNGGYALGVMSRDRYGYIGRAHSGNIVGYHAMLCWFPEYHKAFFISHNMDSETASYERFNEILARHLKLNKPLRNAGAISTKEFSGWNGYYLPVIPKIAPLAYMDNLSGFSKITVHDNFVDIVPFQKAARRLERMAEGNLLTAVGKVDNTHVFYRDSLGRAYISDGFSTLKKISGYYLIAHWASFLLGCSGLVYLLFAGIAQAIRSKKKIYSDNIFGAFLAVLLLLIPLPFFVFQSFSSIGDLSAASWLLFLSSCLLPAGLTYSLILYLKRGVKGLQSKLNFAAVVFSLQWVLVLIISNIIPFRLWV